MSLKQVILKKKKHLTLNIESDNINKSQRTIDL